MHTNKNDTLKHTKPNTKSCHINDRMKNNKKGRNTIKREIKCSQIYEVMAQVN